MRQLSIRVHMTWVQSAIGHSMFVNNEQYPYCIPLQKATTTHILLNVPICYQYETIQTEKKTTALFVTKQ